MNIDIEKERELVRSGYVKNALEYLDELEATRKRETSLDLRVKELERIVRIRDWQLTDQRAQDIRLLAIRYAQERRFPLEAMIPIAAEDYAAQAIHVPSPEKGGDS